MKNVFINLFRLSIHVDKFQLHTSINKQENVSATTIDNVKEYSDEGHWVHQQETERRALMSHLLIIVWVISIYTQ